MTASLTLNQVKKMIQGGESDTLEFKSSTAELRKACQTLCAFLNHRGGRVLIGVKQDGRLIGQKVSDQTRLDIAKELKKFEPAVSVNVHYVTVKPEHFVIVLHAEKGSRSPYIYEGRPYQRIESSTNVMSQHLYEELLVERGHLNHAWDSFYTRQYGIEDLDHALIQKTIQDGIFVKRIPKEASHEDIPQILRRLELLKDGRLNNAAVVLFAKEITSPYLQCMIKMARFKGTTKLADFQDNQQFSGNAFAILDAADHFMDRHLNIASSFRPDSFARVDKFTVPVMGVREALMNAICHRDYRNTGSSISLAIFDDRLELWNTGSLPKPLKISSLKKPHDSCLRNRLIANVFYKRGFIESWGTGTLTIIKECLKHGISEPKFEEYFGGFSITFFFEEPIGPRVYLQQKDKPHDFKDLSQRQQKIIQILKSNGELSASVIKEKLSETIADRTLRDDLSILKKERLINSRGRANYAIWFLVSTESKAV